MNVMTETEFPPLASLAISPSLQSLLEFDERFWTSNESYERPERISADLAQHGQYTSWRRQEVPTVLLPPPRRKKSAVTDVPESPKTISELQSVDSPGYEEILLARPEDVLEDVMGSKDPTNTHLIPPPSPPRYFYPCSDDEEEEGIDQDSASYTLEKSRAVGLPERQRSFSDQCQSSSEDNGGRFVSPRYLTSFCPNVGSGPKEKGKLSMSFFSLTYSYF